MLEAPLKSHAPKLGGPRRVPGAPSLRRDLSDDFAGRRVGAAGDPDDGGAGYVRPRRFTGLRFRLKGGVPRSMVGRVLGGVVLLAFLGGFTAVLWEARSLLLEDPRLLIASSASIQIAGNNHLTRPQLLSVFGDDVDRNLLTVPLGERREQLESLPWVEHATVMRLLPNRVRVLIRERTPVAFVRQGGQIGLVDAHGVLLDLSPEVAADNHYSFPVVTGISAAEPGSTREARMKLFARFMTDLDAGGGEPVSKTLSEVDLSNPEDVKALIPNMANGSSDVLVHFGESDFLKRYRSFEQNLPGWKAAYPKLASVDMRYEHNVVLEMSPGAVVPLAGKAAESVAAAAGKVPTVAAAAVKDLTRRERRAQRRERRPAKVAGKPHAARAVAAKPVKAMPVTAGGHLQTSFDVRARGRDGVAKSHAVTGAQ